MSTVENAGAARTAHHVGIEPGLVAVRAYLDIELFAVQHALPERLVAISEVYLGVEELGQTRRLAARQIGPRKALRQLVRARIVAPTGERAHVGFQGPEANAARAAGARQTVQLDSIEVGAAGRTTTVYTARLDVVAVVTAERAAALEIRGENA